MSMVGLHLHRDEGTARVVLHSGVDGAGELRLYVADPAAHQVVEVSLKVVADRWPVARELRRFGSGQPGFDDDDPAMARFCGPTSTCRMGDLLWVADTGNHALRVIDLGDGRVGTAAGCGRPGDGLGVDPGQPLMACLPAPVAVACVRSAVLMAMIEPPRIWAYLAQEERIGPLVGSGRAACVDGRFDEAALHAPVAMVAVGERLLIADSGAAQIRVAELAPRQLGPLQSPAAAALQRPVGLVTSEHRVFVSDADRGAILALDLRAGPTTVLTAPGALSEPGALEAFGPWLLVADGAADRLRTVLLTTGEVRPLTWSPSA